MIDWGRVSGRPGRRWIERDVDDEIAGHIELKARELERRGVSSEEAWKRANEAFGRAEAIRSELKVIQRGMHRRRNRNMMVDELRADARWAVRSMARAPWFTLFAVLTLALGIAANTSIMSVANGLFFRSVPGVRSPETLVEIVRGPGHVSVSHPDFEMWRDEVPALRGLAAFDLVGLSLDAGSGEAEIVMGLQVSGEYFDVLGTRPSLGRFFAGAERELSPPAVAVISHRLWHERLSGDTAAIGGTIRVNGRPVAVIGVAEEGFAGHAAPARAQVFMPLGSPLPGFHTAASLAGIDNGILELVGRVEPGTELEVLEARLSALANARRAGGGAASAAYIADVRPWAPLPGSFRGAASLFFVVLSVLVGLLLVIACLNVAGLLISRSEHRRGEMAIRISLGASRARVVRQLVAEALALSCVAGVAGVVATYWITGALAAFQLPVAPIPGLELDLRLRPDVRVLGYSVLVVLATGLAFGLLPALRATRPDLVTDLKSAAGSRTRKRSRIQGLLVAAQMAGTIVLLAASGLFLRAVTSAGATDLGFDAADVHVASFDLELAGRSAAESWRFYDQLTRRARELPGVRHAAVAGKLPLAGLSQMAPVQFQGVEPPAGASGHTLANQSVGPDYFAALGIAILEGRAFLDSDDASSRPVVIVNQVLAERMWPGESAIGKTLTTPAPFTPDGDATAGAAVSAESVQSRSWEIVGVAAAARYRRANDPPRPFAYFPAAQRPRTDMVLHVKMAPGSTPPLREIRAIASAIDPGAAAISTGSLESAVAVFVLPQRAGAWVTGVVGSFGLLLGALGVYALTAYRVAGARREIGVRMAVGASAGSVWLGVVRRGMRAPVAGGLAGLAAALATSRFIESFLYGVDPLDPITVAAVILTLVAASLAATAIPAVRAARLDPATVLRAN